MPRIPKLQHILLLSLLVAAALCAPAATPTPKISLLFKGRKAGLAAFRGVHHEAAFKQLAPYLSHYIDYHPNPSDIGKVKGVGMLWGAGDSPCAPSGWSSAFSTMKTPDVMLGFNEPDCPCYSGCDMSVGSAVSVWSKQVGPLKKKGTILGSPGPCKQDAETFLTPFSKGISVPWDVTTLHVYKNNLVDVQTVVEYYIKKYKKPVWITEIACVQPADFTPCTSQSEVSGFIASVVKYFEGNENVVAYSFIAKGYKLGKVWPMMTEDGQITTSGKAYMKAIKTHAK